jgi:hypothetical protein
VTIVGYITIGSDNQVSRGRFGGERGAPAASGTRRVRRNNTVYRSRNRRRIQQEYIGLFLQVGCVLGFVEVVVVGKRGRRAVGRSVTAGRWIPVEEIGAKWGRCARPL